MPGQLVAGVFHTKGLHVQRAEENQCDVPLSSTLGAGLGNMLACSVRSDVELLCQHRGSPEHVL